MLACLNFIANNIFVVKARAISEGKIIYIHQMSRKHLQKIEQQSLIFHTPSHLNYLPKVKTLTYLHLHLFRVNVYVFIGS